MLRARPPSAPALAAAAVTASTSTTSTILNHTYAPFYACYLLKSYHPKRLNQTYIGSTPDPPRRWRQHMGETVGGAFKTRLARPWEMEAIVYGFPTKLQALQFEWAWQNPHASRLLHAVPVATPETEAAEGVSESEPEAAAATTTSTKGCRKAGSKPKADKKKAAPKPVAQFPRTAASNRGQTRIQVLQYMLTVPPWRSFNLRVMLFSDLARTWWDRARLAGPTVRTDAGWNKFEKLLEKEKGKGREMDNDVRVRDAWGERATWLGRVQVDLRREGVDGERLVRIGERQEQDAIGRMRIDDDDFFHAQWSKWTELVSSRDCHLCSQQVDHADHLSFFLCTSASTRASTSDASTDPCTALFHPACLSAHFLSYGTSGQNRRPPLTAAAAAIGTAAPPAVLAPPLLPTHGNCPACDAELHWTDLVRSSYRRMEEVEGKRKKRTRQRAKAGAALGSEAVLADEDQDDGDDDDSASLPPPSPTKRKKCAATAGKSTPATKGRRKPTKKSSATPRLAESADDVIQLGESFEFSSDLGPEDDDDDDNGAFDRTRAREDLDVDFSDGDEATDDEPGDEERSFARLEAAQDALDFARDELLRDDLGDGNDDDIRVDLEAGDDDDDDNADILPASLLAKTISTRAPAQKATSSKRRGSSRGIAKLSDSFASTKPAQNRRGGAKNPASLPPDDSDGLSPLALSIGKSGALARSGGGSKPRSKKAPLAYIEISD